MRITVYDILGWLASGMSNAEILADFPDLTTEDIQATLAFAADRDHHLVAASGIVLEMGRAHSPAAPASPLADI